MQVTTARMQVAAANASARLSHHAGWTSTAADVKGVPQEAGHLRKQANIPEPRDACKELGRYTAGLLQHVELDLATARAAQRRTTAAELGITPLDAMADVESIPARIRFINRLASEMRDQRARVAIVTTAQQDLAGLRRELLPWMAYHLEIGISHFYILYDGTDTDVIAHLRAVLCVTLFFVGPPFASALEVQEMWAFTQMHVQWGGQPGNYKLMVKQGFGVERALRAGLQQGLQWLIHADPDELLYSQTESFNIATVLAGQPHHISAVRFLNYEGQPEAVDLVNRFEQVTLFRVHQHHVSPEAYQHRGGLKLGDNPTFLLLYANGKSAVRIMPGVSQLGPHYFTGPPSQRWVSEDNPSGAWRSVISESCIVLHYAYSYLSDVSQKAARSCPGRFVATAEPAQNASACLEGIHLEFDQAAYSVAVSKDDAEIEDFFLSRNVLTEGSRIRCRDESGLLGYCLLPDVEHYKALAIRAGLMQRFHEPSLILRSHERWLQRQTF